ncbi:hypothetical protein V2J09_005974 [Rumex salicifolius]
MSESSDLVEHVDDEDQAMILLCLLNPTYKTLLTALTYRKGTISLETSDGNIPVVISLRVMGCILATTRKGEDRRKSKQMERTSRDLSQRPRRKQYTLVMEKQATSSEIAQTENKTVRRILRDLQSLQTFVDDKACGIMSIGQIKVHMHDGIIRTLTEVRYISALKKNLISLGTLHVNEFNYKSDSDYVKVSTGL